LDVVSGLALMPALRFCHAMTHETAIPDDIVLTDQGLSATGAGRVLVLACGALAREIMAIKRGNGMDHLDLHCLPAILHNHPEKITASVEAAIAERGSGYEQVFVAYADCGTGGQLQAACDRLGVQMIRGPHCYSFFEGYDDFAARDEITAFYLTDFLARQFDAFVWKPLGLDRHPDLLGMYFGHYTTLVYQSQTNDPELMERARACADRLGLEFEHRHTGYGDLESEIKAL
jgi:hypothetical protein